jgi:hypothetical protein
MLFIRRDPDDPVHSRLVRGWTIAGIVIAGLLVWRILT